MKFAVHCGREQLRARLQSGELEYVGLRGQSALRSIHASSSTCLIVRRGPAVIYILLDKLIYYHNFHELLKQQYIGHIYAFRVHLSIFTVLRDHDILPCHYMVNTSMIRGHILIRIMFNEF